MNFPAFLVETDTTTLRGSPAVSVLSGIRHPNALDDLSDGPQIPIIIVVLQQVLGTADKQIGTSVTLIAQDTLAPLDLVSPGLQTFVFVLPVKVHLAHRQAKEKTNFG